MPDPQTAPDFSSIQGHQIHDPSTISAAPPDTVPITGVDPGSLAEDFIPTLDKLTSHIENYTQQGREMHPILARLGDATREAKELLAGGKAAGKPMGTESGLTNNPVTATMSMGDAAPEAGEMLEAGATKVGDALADRSAFHPNPEHGGIPLNFDSIPGHQVREMPQGGHAGGGVASVEELNRPGRFVKVSRSGQLTDQGKVPDFNLQPGEAGYQVTPEGYELRAGQETPATKSGVDKYHKEVFKPKSSVKNMQGPSVEKSGLIQNARKILNDPAATADDKAIATRQLEHQKETQFEGEKSPVTFRTDSNGTRWAKSSDSPAEISVPKHLEGDAANKYAQEKLDLQKNFAKSRTNPAGAGTMASKALSQ